MANTTRNMCSVHVCSAVTCHLYFWQNNQDHLHATMVTDTKMRVCKECWPWRRTFSCCPCWGSNLWPFDHKSSAPYPWATPAQHNLATHLTCPLGYGQQRARWTGWVWSQWCVANQSHPLPRWTRCTCLSQSRNRPARPRMIQPWCWHHQWRCRLSSCCPPRLQIPPEKCRDAGVLVCTKL